MKAFTLAGGRLFKIAGIFTIFCGVVVAIQAYFIKTAMNQVYAIATMEQVEGIPSIQVPAFYGNLIAYLDPGKVVTALSVVLVAIAARYGAREVTKNIAEGAKYKSEVHMNGTGGVSTSEEISK